MSDALKRLTELAEHNLAVMESHAAEYATLLEMLGHGWSFDALQLTDRNRFRFIRWRIAGQTWAEGVGATIREAAEAARATETPPAEGTA